VVNVFPSVNQYTSAFLEAVVCIVTIQFLVFDKQIRLTLDLSANMLLLLFIEV